MTATTTNLKINFRLRPHLLLINFTIGYLENHIQLTNGLFTNLQT